MESIRHFVLFLTVSFSFGGFTFYAAAVVPIGSDVFDATSQGFVTQRVTHVINAASAVTLVILLWEGFASRSIRTPPSNRIFALLVAVYTICLVSLVAFHPQLDALLDPGDHSVKAPDRFYSLHQIYLWISVGQWLATVGLVWLICKRRMRTHTSVE